MHHLSHLTNDCVHLLKGKAPSSTLKVSSHTLSSVCFYNRPEDVGELGGLHSLLCPALSCSHFCTLQIESGPVSGYRSCRFMRDKSTEMVDSFEFGNSDDNWEEEAVPRKKLFSFNCLITEHV